MNKKIHRTLWVLSIVSLTGCGLKGPLYFPSQGAPKGKRNNPFEYRAVAPKKDPAQQKPVDKVGSAKSSDNSNTSHPDTNNNHEDSGQSSLAVDENSRPASDANISNDKARSSQNSTHTPWYRSGTVNSSN